MDEAARLRAAVLARFTTGYVDLQEELESILRVLRFQREALTNKMTEGFGYKQMELSVENAKLAKELTLCYQKAVDSKVKLDKHLKDRAEEMSPAEEVASVAKYIQGLDSGLRRKLLIDSLAFHNANCTNSQWYIKAE
jgi:hypothetical protein